MARKIRNLRDGSAIPRRRRDIDIQVDEQIQEAIRQFDEKFYHGGDPIPHSEAITYTLHMANLIGQHEECGFQDQD